MKAAEAEAEAKYLQGQGIARQRQAIVAGLRDSVKDFSGTIQVRGGGRGTGSRYGGAGGHDTGKGGAGGRDTGTGGAGGHDTGTGGQGMVN